jgi:hypothetical protein
MPVDVCFLTSLSAMLLKQQTTPLQKTSFALKMAFCLPKMECRRAEDTVS